jgi:hypothetical protein
VKWYARTAVEFLDAIRLVITDLKLQNYTLISLFECYSFFKVFPHVYIVIMTRKGIVFRVSRNTVTSSSLLIEVTSCYFYYFKYSI